MVRARILTGLLVVLVLGLLIQLATVSSPGLESKGPAAELTFPKAEGLPARLSDLKGKVVILDFWASWCGPCRMSIPELESLHRQYRDKGLQVVGVSLDLADTRANAPAVQKELGMTYPSVFATDISDFKDQNGDLAYKVEALPTLFLIDKRGQIRAQINGYDPAGGLKDKVLHLLDE